MSFELTSKKFLLLLLYAPINGAKYNDPIEGRTRLQKLVFIFQKEILKDFQKDTGVEVKDILQFEPWHFGPFSKDLFYDIEFLINQQFIRVEESNKLPLSSELDEYNRWIEEDLVDGYSEYVQERFALSGDRGISKASELWEDLSDNQQKILIDFKNSFRNVSLDRILSYVYNKYEDMTEKSIIREKYL